MLINRCRKLIHGFKRSIPRYRNDPLSRRKLSFARTSSLTRRPWKPRPDSVELSQSIGYLRLKSTVDRFPPPRNTLDTGLGMTLVRDRPQSDCPSPFAHDRPEPG